MKRTLTGAIAVAMISLPLLAACGTPADKPDNSTSPTTTQVNKTVSQTPSSTPPTQAQKDANKTFAMTVKPYLEDIQTQDLASDTVTKQFVQDKSITYDVFIANYKAVMQKMDADIQQIKDTPADAKSQQFKTDLVSALEESSQALGMRPDAIHKDGTADQTKVEQMQSMITDFLNKMRVLGSQDQ